MHVLFIAKSNGWVGLLVNYSPFFLRWKQFNWVEDYWSGFDKALTVKKMLLLNLTNSKNFEAMWHEMVMDRYSKGMQP